MNPSNIRHFEILCHLSFIDQNISLHNASASTTIKSVSWTNPRRSPYLHSSSPHRNLTKCPERTNPVPLLRSTPNRKRHQPSALQLPHTSNLNRHKAITMAHHQTCNTPMPNLPLGAMDTHLRVIHHNKATHHRATQRKDIKMAMDTMGLIRRWAINNSSLDRRECITDNRRASISIRIIEADPALSRFASVPLHAVVVWICYSKWVATQEVTRWKAKYTSSFVEQGSREKGI